MDLSDIWGYVASDASEATATRLVAQIASRFEDVRRLPLAGVARPQLRPGLRAIFQGKYVIYYLSLPGETVILRIVHGSRDMEAIGEQRGFQS